jgi:hypothetical protein
MVCKNSMRRWNENWVQQIFSGLVSVKLENEANTPITSNNLASMTTINTRRSVHYNVLSTTQQNFKS